MKKNRILRITLITLASLFCVLALLSLISGRLIMKYALPEAEKLLGVSVKLESASLNLLSGTFTANGLSVANPEGFDEPYFLAADRASVHVSLVSLLRGRIVISSASLGDFVLHVVRNSKGDINAFYFAEKMQVKSSEEENKPESGEKASAPRMKVSRMKADLTLRYVDHAFSTNTIDYSFKTSVSVEDIANFGPKDSFGTISVDGHLVGNPKVLSSVMSARVAPLSDPLHPTFEANGHVKSVHSDEIDALSREIGIYFREFTLDTPFKSTEGRLRGDFRLTLHEPTPLGKLARKLKNVQLPPVLTVTVPVRGTVEKPDIDWTGAILQSLLDNALENINEAVKKIDLNQEAVEGQVDKLVDSVKGLFKKKEEKTPEK